MTKILEPWRWPIAVVLSVALASLAALFLLGPQLGVHPETLGDVKRWLAGGAAALGALLLPALKAWLTADSDGDGKPDWMDKTPTGPRDTLVALLVAGAVVGGVGTLQGCGAGALGVQADMVAVGGILAAEADAALVRARAADLEEVVTDARAECGSGDCDEERRDHWRGELAARERRWAPAMACREQVPEVLRGWGEALDTARVAQTSSVGLELLARHGGRFVLAYDAFRGCVETAAPERVDLPDPPPELLVYAEAFTQRSPAASATAGGEAGAR